MNRTRRCLMREAWFNALQCAYRDWQADLCREHGVIAFPLRAAGGELLRSIARRREDCAPATTR